MPQLPPDQAIIVALELHRSGRLADAEGIYRQILAGQPDYFDALHMLGVLSRQLGRLDESISLLERAIIINPNIAEAHNNLGNTLATQQKFPDAIAAYSRAIRLKPDFAPLYLSLGNILRQQGKLDDAARAYSAAIRLQPKLAEAHLNFGSVLFDQGNLDQAIAACNRAIQFNPNLPQAHNNLGNIFWQQQKLDEAAAAYARAIELQPGYREPNWSLGKILTNQKRFDKALACFQRALEFNPDHSEAHLNLARALAKAGQRDPAIAAYRKAIQLNPDSPDWQFELAALTGDGSAPSAPPSYVKALFDSYAPTFDRHLLDDLEYRTPRHLFQAVLAATQIRQFDILDLGCGTGLCGEQFKPYARHLAGVDLSPAMIQSAAARRITSLPVYDELITGDLIPALQSHPDRFNLILAGDVLVYVGDLSSLMPAIAAALPPGGLFAFSIEHHDGPGFILQPHERFAHSITYIEQIAAAAGLQTLSAHQAPLRKQRGQETPGWIIVLTKSPPPTPRALFSPPRTPKHPNLPPRRPP